MWLCRLIFLAAAVGSSASWRQSCCNLRCCLVVKCGGIERCKNAPRLMEKCPEFCQSVAEIERSMSSNGASPVTASTSHGTALTTTFAPPSTSASTTMATPGGMTSSSSWLRSTTTAASTVAPSSSSPWTTMVTPGGLPMPTSTSTVTPSSSSPSTTRTTSGGRISRTSTATPKSTTTAAPSTSASWRDVMNPRRLPPPRWSLLPSTSLWEKSCAAPEESEFVEEYGDVILWVVVSALIGLLLAIIAYVAIAANRPCEECERLKREIEACQEHIPMQVI